MDNSEKAQIINLLMGDSKNRHQRDKEDMEQLFSLVFADTSSSSSEDLEVQPEPQSTCLSFVDTIDAYDADAFKSNMRLEKTTAEYLIALFSQSKCLPGYSHGGRSRIGPRKSFYMYLWYIGNTVTFRQLGNLFCLKTSSAWTAVQRVSSWLVSIGHEYVKWPEGPAADETRRLFEEKNQISGVIGAIGCTHINIKAPKTNKHTYVNTNGCYSLAMQAVVDAEMKFIDITCGEPGSLDGNQVLHRSKLYAKVQTNYSHMFSNGSFIVGDSVYPSTFWLVSPFKDDGDLTDAQLRFNDLHSATRTIVENTFELLKSRFRRLVKFTEQNNLSAVTNVIVSACVLHNICIIKNDLYTESVPEELDDTEDNLEVSNVENGAENIVDRRQILFKTLQNRNII